MSLESTPSDFILWRIAPSGIPMLFILWYLDMSVLLLDEEDELDVLEEDFLFLFLFFFFLPRFLMAANNAACGLLGSMGASSSSSSSSSCALLVLDSTPLPSPQAVLPVNCCCAVVGECIRRAADFAAASFTKGDLGDLEDLLPPSS